MKSRGTSGPQQYRAYLGSHSRASHPESSGITKHAFRYHAADQVQVSRYDVVIGSRRPG